jgi:hypothetical protein
MNLMRSKVILVGLILSGVAGCDELEKRSTPKPAGSLSLVSTGGSTFLIEPAGRKVFSLANGEFVEVPIVTAASFSGKNGLRNFRDEIKDLAVSTDVKFFNGRLYYKVSVSPVLSKEYQAYLKQWLENLKSKKPLPTEPSVKYRNPNWLSVVDKVGNTVHVNFLDADSFIVSQLPIRLSNGGLATRTSVVELDGVTRSHMRYEGSIAMTGGDFSRIKETNATYVLE